MGFLDKVVESLSRKAGVPLPSEGTGRGAADTGSSGASGESQTNGSDSADVRKDRSFPAVCYIKRGQADYERIIFENAAEMRMAIGVLSDADRVNTVHTRRGISVYAKQTEEGDVCGGATDYHGNWITWRGDYIVARFYCGVLQDMREADLRLFRNEILDKSDVVTELRIVEQRERARLYGGVDDVHVCTVTADEATDSDYAFELDEGIGYSYVPVSGDIPLYGGVSDGKESV